MHRADQVDKISRGSRSVPPTSEEEPFDEDVAMEDDESDVPAEKPKRKKKERKVIPAGRNGLKKKRIMKSRMTTDAKGYMGELPLVLAGGLPVLMWPV